MLIGLGGQGQNALVAAKTRMLDAYGEIPPIIKFLAIDSAPLDDDNGNPDNKGHLVGNEYLSISVPNAAEYIDDHREALSQCCLLYTSPSPRDGLLSRMPSS